MNMFEWRAIVNELSPEGLHDELSGLRQQWTKTGMYNGDDQTILGEISVLYHKLNVVEQMIDDFSCCGDEID